MLNVFLVGIDPGGTTGIVHVVLADGGITDCRAKEITGQANVFNVLSFLKEYQLDVVVAESFILRKDKAVQLSGQRMVASEIFGAVKAYCDMNGIELVPQLPAVKDTVSKQLLVSTGLWSATRGLPHARDAARHVLHYCLKNKLLKIGDIH